jgi:hypothetical protein
MSDEKFQLTAKGMFEVIIREALHRRINDPEKASKYSDEQWHRFEAFLIKRLREQDPTAIYPALIFDGYGGEIIGATMAEDV